MCFPYHFTDDHLLPRRSALTLSFHIRLPYPPPFFLYPPSCHPHLWTVPWHTASQSCSFLPQIHPPPDYRRTCSQPQHLLNGSFRTQYAGLTTAQPSLWCQALRLASHCLRSSFPALTGLYHWITSPVSTYASNFGAYFAWLKPGPYLDCLVPFVGSLD